MINLYPHQKEGAKYGIERKSGAFFMGMRTGKTYTSLAALDGLNLNPVLIICPLSVVASWESALISWGVDPVQIQTVETPNQAVLPTPKYFIINFEKCEKCDIIRIRHSVQKSAPWINLSDWGSIVLDEGYRIANPENDITKYLLRFPKPAGQSRFILSGRPVSETPLDAATQFLFIDGQYFGCRDIGEYMYQYWRWNKWKYQWEPRNRLHKIHIKKYIAENAYIKTIEELDLGCTKFYEQHKIPATEAQQRAQKWLSVATTYINRKGEERPLTPLVRCTLEQLNAAGIDPNTREIISTAKQQHILDSYRDNPRQILVISRFVEPLKVFKRIMDRADIPGEIITGQTPHAERERIRQDFQTGEIHIVAGQVKPLKMGLDFSSLDTLYYISNSFSQDDRAQSEDRGQHTARKTPYIIIDLHTTGSNDATITDILTVKKSDALHYISALNQKI